MSSRHPYQMIDFAAMTWCLFALVACQGRNTVKADVQPVMMTHGFRDMPRVYSALEADFSASALALHTLRLGGRSIALLGFDPTIDCVYWDAESATEIVTCSVGTAKRNYLYIIARGDMLYLLPVVADWSINTSTGKLVETQPPFPEIIDAITGSNKMSPGIISIDSKTLYVSDMITSAMLH